MKTKYFFFAACAATMVMFAACSPSGEQTKYNDSTKLWPAYSNGKYGFIDKSGTFAIMAQFDAVYSFSCGYAIVELNNRELYINTDGKLQSTPTFDEAFTFCNNYSRIILNNTYGLFDKSFNYSIQPMFFDLTAVSANGLAGARLSKDAKAGYVNTKGEQKIQPVYDEVSYFIGDYAVVKMGDSYGVINSSGEFVIQPIYYTIQALGNKRYAFKLKSGDNYGVMDASGTVVAQQIYNKVSTYTYTDWNRILVMDASRKYGYIDKDGEVKIMCIYDRATPFMEGYAYVTINGQPQVIDESGDVVLMLQSGESVEWIHNGLMMTYLKGSYYYKDMKGNAIYTWTTLETPIDDDDDYDDDDDLAPALKYNSKLNECVYDSQIRLGNFVVK